MGGGGEVKLRYEGGTHAPSVRLFKPRSRNRRSGDFENVANARTGGSRGGKLEVEVEVEGCGIPAQPSATVAEVAKSTLSHGNSE